MIDKKPSPSEKEKLQRLFRACHAVTGLISEHDSESQVANEFAEALMQAEESHSPAQPVGVASMRKALKSARAQFKYMAEFLEDHVALDFEDCQDVGMTPAEYCRRAADEIKQHLAVKLTAEPESKPSVKEEAFQAQARICPHCFNDHAEHIECCRDDESALSEISNKLQLYFKRCDPQGQEHLVPGTELHDFTVAFIDEQLAGKDRCIETLEKENAELRDRKRRVQAEPVTEKFPNHSQNPKRNTKRLDDS